MMATRSFRPYVPLLIHLLGWTLLVFALLLYNPLLTWNVELPTEFWIKQGVLLALYVGLFYLNAQVWVPRLLLRDRVVPFVLLVLGAVVGAYALVKVVETGLNLPELMHQAFHPDGGGKRWGGGGGRFNRFDVFVPLSVLMVLGISTSIAAVQTWQRDAHQRQVLEQEKTSTELSFLKAQINPHFFFNTLNNIYALTLIDAETAREALHRLSRMMRYVLYETQAETTLLSKEIAFVQDYIQLMQLRLTDKVTVHVEPPSPLRDVPVAPMLLLPFVENAFKHGVSATQPSRIHVGIHQQNGTLDVDIRNTVFPEKAPSLEVGSGIGLANTRRRLDLLYPGRYDLTVHQDAVANEHQVHLLLHLS